MTENIKTLLGPAELKEESLSTKVKRFVGDYGILIFFVVIFVFLAVAAPNFLTLNNLVNVVRQSSIIGLIALGMTDKPAPTKRAPFRVSNARPYDLISSAASMFRGNIS